MRTTFAVTAIACLLAGSTLAQNNEPARDPGREALPNINLAPARDPGVPAIKTGEGNTPGAPIAGANSFTEEQAKARIEDRGYKNVARLKKDENGIWRGTALKDGKSVQVSLDFQGNVVSQ